jgi:3-phenylpropionate/trans-cinnamate dioxygenase ferredoxin reductase subunit
VIVGAGVAGVRTADHLRRIGYDGAITLLSADTDPPYDRPPLSKQVLRGEREPVSLGAEALEVDLRLGVRAESVDTDNRSVRLGDGSAIGYDALVIATGARPRRLPGVTDRAGMHVLRTLGDCRALRTEPPTARRVAVVGGGFIGCEVAASLRSLGHEVAIVEMAAAPLIGVLGPTVAARVTEMHESAGVELYCNAPVSGIEGDARVQRVQLADGRFVAADLVVVGLGVVPEVEWLASSTVEIDNGVSCDDRGRTNVEDVYAVGDVSAWFDQRTGRRHRFEHWTSAVEQAAVVAATVVGQEAESDVTVPYFWSDQYKVKIQSLGVPEGDADVRMFDINDTKQLALYSRDGKLTAAVGFSAPSFVMKMRPLLATEASIDDATAHVQSLLEG